MCQEALYMLSNTSNTEKTELYYMDQSDWGISEFYALHRYLHKLISKRDKKIEEIKQMDPDKMSENTKVLLYCIIKYYGLENLFEFSNLTSLKDCKPLKKPLVLDMCNANYNTIYGEMNVIL